MLESTVKDTLTPAQWRAKWTTYEKIKLTEQSDDKDVPKGGGDEGDNVTLYALKHDSMTQLNDASIKPEGNEEISFDYQGDNGDMESPGRKIELLNNGIVRLHFHHESSSQSPALIKPPDE